MVKVIKGPETFTTTQVCPGCSAELEATESDLLVGKFGGDYTEPGSDTLYFVCPVCDYDVVLEGAHYNLLERVRRNVKKLEPKIDTV